MTRTVLRRTDSGSGSVTASHESAEERTERIAAAAASGSEIRLTRGQRAAIRKAQEPRPRFS
ncbi:hypothetical protein BH23ACT12_BH23ACT12_21530 [soil metagenome]